MARGREEPAIPPCCDGDEYNAMFTSKQATRTAAHFRRKGLGGSALDLVRGVAAVAPAGSSLLEVGGGVGQIQVTLLEMGVAASAINVELSSNWDEAATTLLAERHLEHRVQRAVGDFVERARSFPTVDVVVLHRVVCCYPDWRAMLEAVVARADRVIALTFPVDTWWTRTGIWMGNLMCRVGGRSFRGYVHKPDSMLDLIRAAGFAITQDGQGRIWRTVVALHS